MSIAYLVLSPDTNFAKSYSRTLLFIVLINILSVVMLATFLKSLYKCNVPVPSPVNFAL